MSNVRFASQSRRPGVMAAMVLGTALWAPLATAEAAAVADLSRYCTVCWRNAGLSPDCWADSTQDVLVRLIDRLSPSAWQQALAGDGEEHRELLRAIDAVKKRNQRARKPLALRADLLADRAGNPQLEEERARVDQAASQVLSERQQRILQLSFDGWSVQELAGELGLPAEQVSDEKYKAIGKLRAYLTQNPN